ARFESVRLEQGHAAGVRAERERGAGQLRERTLWLERQAERLGGGAAAAGGGARRPKTPRERPLREHRKTGNPTSPVTAELHQIDDEHARHAELRAQEQERLAELRVALAARESERDALARLEREREGYGAGVRAIFAEHASSELHGVIGTVADLLDVP